MATGPTAKRLPNNLITSLAILKANWDVAGTDYIENFVPFVAECLRTSAGDDISESELQNAVLHTFGIRMPQGALRTIVQRCVKKGLAVRKGKKYFRHNEALTAIDLCRLRSDALRKHECLVDSLRQFTKERFEIEWTQEQAEAVLQSYVEQDCFDILAAAVEGSPIPASALPDGDASFIVNSFVQTLSKRDPQGFEFLETVVKGTMLANVLVFPELGKVKQKFNGVEIYFDTPFLIRALGLEGSLRQQPCTELLDLLYRQNADLCIFEHTFNEISGVLDAAAKNARNGGDRTPNADFFELLGTRDYKASDIELLIARLRTSIQHLRIKVKPKPDHTSELGLNEKFLDEVISTDLPHLNQHAKEHDIDSLTSIHRLRHGETFSELEHCRAVFVTTNSTLVKAAMRFFKAQYENTTVPLCVKDHVLTTVVWLKDPQVAPELPRKRIIADCYAAMNPDDRLWRTYLQEITQLKARKDLSEDDFNLLRYSTESRVSLMELTLGDSRRVSEETIGRLLALTRDAVTADARAAAVAARAETVSLSKENSLKSVIIDEERTKRIEAELKVEKARAETAERDRLRAEKFQRYAFAVGRFAGRSFIAVTSLIVLGFTALPLLAPTATQPWNIVASVVLLAGACWSAYSGIYGWSVVGVGRALELRAAKCVESKLLSWFAVDGDIKEHQDSSVR
jgi:hypothetical protein